MGFRNIAFLGALGKFISEALFAIPLVCLGGVFPVGCVGLVENMNRLAKFPLHI